MFFERNTGGDIYHSVCVRRFSDDKRFEEIDNVYMAVFRSKEKADAFCAWYNNKEVGRNE